VGTSWGTPEIISSRSPADLLMIIGIIFYIVENSIYLREPIKEKENGKSNRRRKRPSE
jgi:hypothetical protein